MSAEGWNKVYRSIQDHWIWSCEPFSRGQAFIDLLLMANHKDSKIMINGSLVEVKRGQRITSLRKLSERWKWSVKKVKHFLEQLKKDEMIAYESDSYKTLITIINYSKYQDKETPLGTTNTSVDDGEGNTEETQRKHEGNTEETQRKTNKNDKEYIKNDKNEEEGKEGEEKTPSTPPLSFPTSYHEVIYNQWTENNYRTWFMNSDIEDKENEIVISVKSEFMKDIINEKFKKQLDILLGKKVVVSLKE